MAQFAKYGPNAEKIHKGRIMEQIKEQERSRSPRPRHRDDYRHKDYRRRSCSRSRDRSSRDRYRERDRDYRRRSRSYSRSPTYCKDDRRGRYDDERRSRSRSPCGRLTATLMVSWTPTPIGEKAHAIWLYIVPRAADIALLAVLVLILFRVGSRVACSSFWFSALQESRD